MKYPSNPELIATIETVDCDGNSEAIGDRIAGVYVRQDKDTARDGILDLDIRGWRKNVNLVVRIPLPELFAALASAVLNADRA